MIDWTRVNELRDEVGADDFPEVIDLFLEEVDAVMHRLRTAPDPALYEEDLHFIKGSALNLGFARLGDLCQAGERDAAMGKASCVDLGEILLAYERSKAEFLMREAA